MSLRLMQNATIDCALFRQNVAYSGGGLKISDCENVTLGDRSNCEAYFEGNIAVEGGAVHMEPGEYQQNFYKVCSRPEI